jgi:hypothetical protein
LADENGVLLDGFDRPTVEIRCKAYAPCRSISDFHVEDGDLVHVLEIFDALKANYPHAIEIERIGKLSGGLVRIPRLTSGVDAQVARIYEFAP